MVYAPGTAGSIRVAPLPPPEAVISGGGTTPALVEHEALAEPIPDPLCGCVAAGAIPLDEGDAVLGDVAAMLIARIPVEGVGAAPVEDGTTTDGDVGVEMDGVLGGWVPAGVGAPMPPPPPGTELSAGPE